MSFLSMASLRPVVLSGPSGAGKSTLLKMLLEKFPQCFTFSISHTSRKPRPGEVNGRDYVFLSTEDMVKGIHEGKYIECAQFNGELYGTPREALTCNRRPSLSSMFSGHKSQLLRSFISDLQANFQNAMVNMRTQANPRICLLDVDANGVRSIHAAKPAVDARFIFVGPPSFEALEQRIRCRGTETEDKIQWRLQQAQIDMDFAYGLEGRRIYNAYIVNDDVQTAYEKLVSILIDDIDAIVEPQSTSQHPDDEEPQTMFPT